MIRVCLLKRRRREVKVDPKLGGQKNVPSLVANGRKRRRFFCLVANGRKRRRFFCLVANGRKRRRVFCLVANGRRMRKFPCLVGNGRRRRRRRFFFTSFHFPPKQFYLDLRFFPLILRFYFTMVLGHYLCISSFFLGL